MGKIGRKSKSFVIFAIAIVICLQIGTNLAQPCQLDDVQKTEGNCTPIKSCRYVIGQLYSGGRVKRCSSSGDLVCCPTGKTLSQKKCAEYKEILKSPRTFGQPRFDRPHCAYQGNSLPFIVGGRDAHEFEFPHAVGLGYGNSPDNLQFLCGATLISDTYLVTAAHCVNNNKHGPPKWAVIGDVTLKTSTSIYRKRVPIKEWIMHPNYAPPKIYDDIALLKLGEKLDLSRFILPACLGDPVVTPKNDGQVQAIGWGQTGVGESQATNLQAVNLSVIATKKCNQDFADDSNKPFRYPEGFRKSQFCAGDTSQADGSVGKDTCNGDSGGGVVVNPEISCLLHLVGVTSLGSKYCGYGEPAVYTKVVAYIDWIERIVWS